MSSAVCADQEVQGGADPGSVDTQPENVQSPAVPASPVVVSVHASPKALKAETSY